MKKAIIAPLIAVVLAVSGASASAAVPNQRTDMRVLVLSATGNEPTTTAWEATLKREGVPYDELVAAPGHTPYTLATFADTLPDGTPRAKYQAVIVATGGLIYQNEAGQYVSALGPDEWQALATYEATYGIRQVTAFAYPTPDYGLNYPTVAGDQGGVVGQLTSAGNSVFPYLNGPVPIDQGAYGYQTTPADGANFQTLVSGPNGSALLGVYTHPDGRQEMISTVDANTYQLHNLLLRHGMLSWVTRGVYLGTERNYLTMEVDDIFESSELWDTTTHSESTTSTIRMTASDVTRAVNWSLANGFRLDLPFNGEGSDDAGSKDKLTAAFMNNKSRFYWLNHTYSHLDFTSTTPLLTIETEIQKNINWAKSHKLPAFDKSELITGGHRGLDNPSMPQAFTDIGIRWFGDDASLRPQQWQLGPALSLPRYPTNVYYNAATKAQELDEYNYLYLPSSLGGVCQDTATTTCFSQPATWDEFVNREATTMLRHVLGNDPRPHYSHQANLASDGILYPVMDEVLRRYRAYFKPALQQPVFRQAGALLALQAGWQANGGQLTGYIQGGKVHVVSSSSSTIQFPLAGVVGVGGLYGGQQSGWTSIAPGASLELTPVS